MRTATGDRGLMHAFTAVSFLCSENKSNGARWVFFPPSGTKKNKKTKTKSICLMLSQRAHGGFLADGPFKFMSKVATSIHNQLFISSLAVCSTWNAAKQPAAGSSGVAERLGVLSGAVFIFRFYKFHRTLELKIYIYTLAFMNFSNENESQRGKSRLGSSRNGMYFGTMVRRLHSNPNPEQM